MLRAALICIFLLLVQRRNPYLAGMTIQQKTAAIQSIVTNHQDNIADLALIFASKPVPAGGD